MIPIKFKQAYEIELGAGNNPNTGNLPYVVTREHSRTHDDPEYINNPLRKYADPVNLVSCWRLSPQELEEVNRTGVIYVAVMSNSHSRTQPPISVHGANPLEYPEPYRHTVESRTYEEEIEIIKSYPQFKKK